MYAIKLIKENDLEVLSDVFSRSFTEADKNKPWDKNHSYEYLTYCFKKQPDMFFGAFTEKGKIIGAGMVDIKPWRTGIRCSNGIIFVDTEYQKQGIATLLAKKIIGEAVEKYHATSFEAITFATKEFPLSWYKKIGITPDQHAVLIKGNCLDILQKIS